MEGSDARHTPAQVPRYARNDTERRSSFLLPFSSFIFPPSERIFPPPSATHHQKRTWFRRRGRLLMGAVASVEEKIRALRDRFVFGLAGRVAAIEEELAHVAA